MALKKSQLYSSLWQSCDELRGGMDAGQYKDYVLTLLFMKYVSDKYAGKPGALIEVPEGGGFADMVKLKGDKEIGDKINKIHRYDLGRRSPNRGYTVMERKCLVGCSPDCYIFRHSHSYRWSIGNS